MCSVALGKGSVCWLMRLSRCTRVAATCCCYAIAAAALLSVAMRLLAVAIGLSACVRPLAYRVWIGWCCWIQFQPPIQAAGSSSAATGMCCLTGSSAVLDWCFEIIHITPLRGRCSWASAAIASAFRVRSPGLALLQPAADAPPRRQAHQNLRPVRSPLSVAQEVEGRVGRGALLLRALPPREQAPQPLGPNLRFQGFALVGEVAEWSKANDSKSFEGQPSVGSNPTLSVIISYRQPCTEMR